MAACTPRVLRDTHLRGVPKDDKVLCESLEFTVILRRPRSGGLEGRANTRPSLPRPVPLFRPDRLEPGPPGRAFAAEVLGGENFGDLHRIQRRALAQIVG